MVLPPVFDDECFAVWIPVARDEALSPREFQLFERVQTLRRTDGVTQAIWLCQQVRKRAELTFTPDARRVEAEAYLTLGNLLRVEKGQADPAEMYRAAITLNRSLSRHNLGVALNQYANWLEDQADWFAAWEQYSHALDLWKQLAREHGARGNVRHYNCYISQIQYFEKRLQVVLTRVEASSVRDQSDDAGAVDVPTPSPKPPPVTFTHASRQWYYEIGLEELPVMQDQVAASISGAGIANANASERAYVGQTIIFRETLYLPIGLNDGKKVLKLNSKYQHAVARVCGQSMNAAHPIPLNDRDLVLVRGDPLGNYSPQDREIVIAVMPGEPTERAMIKRFRQNGNQAMLCSESLEPDLPEHQSLEIETRTADSIRFVGQAIAVLKLLGKVN